MSNKKYTSFLILVVIPLLFVGIYNTYSFWWDYDFDTPPTKGIVSFFSLGISALIFSHVLISLLFVPKNIQFRFLTIPDNEKFLIFAKEIGGKKANKLKLANGIIFITLFMLFALSLFLSIKEYEKYQLSHFGIQQEVEIKQISKSIKGLDLAVIEYNYMAQHYSKELYLDRCKKGQKKIIIFSKENPNIAIWLDEYLNSTR
jgi:hypothetical protein